MKEKRVFVALIFFVFFFPVLAKAETIEEVLPVIIQAESLGRPWAVNKREGAYGLCQIRRLLLKEYNRAEGTNYITKDLLDRRVNLKIARWYLRRLGKRLKIHKCFSRKTLVLSYNWGLRKFLRWKRKHPSKEIPNWAKHHPNWTYRHFFNSQD